MDVHPTKNVSIGIDPYPYRRNIETMVDKPWKLWNSSGR
jgi:hypothetical protein